MRLLMICLGNICRSPLAEGALRARLDAAGLDWVQVDSAGTGAWHAGEPPDRRSIAVAAAAGVDIGRQRARQLQRDDYFGFDWLLCADRSVLRDVRARAPMDASARAALLLDWARSGGDGGTGSAVDTRDDAESDQTPDRTLDQIPDPYTGGPEDFRRVWRMVDTAALAIVERIAAGRVRADPGRPGGTGG
jgi:protein-tyrosine phosphatase